MTKTVCFTGHREIPQEHYLKLRDALTREIEAQIEKGATVFRAGGALGFDTLAALCVLNLRRQYPHIRLELILPCPTQTRGWSSSDKGLYQQILEQADSYRYVSNTYFSGVLQMRNLALIREAEVCIAYLHSSHGGGTAFTCAQAIKNGLELINLFDLL
jgi:uncharacterized phage-like protein YoqJ